MSSTPKDTVRKRLIRRRPGLRLPRHRATNPHVSALSPFHSGTGLGPSRAQVILVGSARTSVEGIQPGGSALREPHPGESEGVGQRAVLTLGVENCAPAGSTSR